ncbi:uncharacterized protein LOC129316043 isoform X2 [Prosopis cineraria]|uniref:uncharacterized protein LOC129316043 isoform X2 n=1 Tax=Prosopis cineraria TaxID=364024 RepID=UPI00240F783C|nr:uncharacterized protein LOC129316043 isoform X2 [Prosopis cineraria]
MNKKKLVRITGVPKIENLESSHEDTVTIPKEQWEAMFPKGAAPDFRKPRTEQIVTNQGTLGTKYVPPGAKKHVGHGKICFERHKLSISDPKSPAELIGTGQIVADQGTSGTKYVPPATKKHEDLDEISFGRHELSMFDAKSPAELFGTGQIVTDQGSSGAKYVPPVTKKNVDLGKISFGKRELSIFDPKSHAAYRSAAKVSQVQQCLLDNLWFSNSTKNSKWFSVTMNCLNYYLANLAVCYLVMTGDHQGIYASELEILKLKHTDLCEAYDNALNSYSTIQTAKAEVELKLWETQQKLQIMKDAFSSVIEELSNFEVEEGVPFSQLPEIRSIIERQESAYEKVKIKNAEDLKKENPPSEAKVEEKKAKRKRQQCQEYFDQGGVYLQLEPGEILALSLTKRSIYTFNYDEKLCSHY